MTARPQMDVIALLITYAVHVAMLFAQIAPLVLVAVLASIPVALPSMFTLAATVGARISRHLMAPLPYTHRDHNYRCRILLKPGQEVRFKVKPVCGGGYLGNESIAPEPIDPVQQ